MKILNIDTKSETLLVAEIGNNHEGSLEQAIKMVRGAAKTGVQAVKFQTYITEYFVSPENPQRFQQLKGYELSQKDFLQLSHIAREEGLIFLSTPFEQESADFLNEIVPAFKIASSDNTHYPLLKHIAAFGKPIILSTGCANLEIINTALQTIKNTQLQNNLSAPVAILHCTTSYPTIPEDCNLLAIVDIKKRFSEYAVGYSDHTLGIDAALYAGALGAEIIEKHFTLDKNYSNFHDHKLSATPEELKLLVDKLKEQRILLGHGDKKPCAAEQQIEEKIRRAICARHDIEAGQTITNSDLCWTRPIGDGIAPGSEELIVGKQTTTLIKQGQRILLSLLKK